MSARSCRDLRADLSAYLDGDLDAASTDEIRGHLESCAACRSELELMRRTVGALRRLPDLPPPAAILTGVRARLRPEPWYRRLLDGRQWQLGMPIGALATVLVVIGIALFQARHPEIPKTALQSPVPWSPAPPASPAPEMQAKPTPIAPSLPAALDKGAGRRDATPPAAPARAVFRAKEALAPAAKPQAAGGGYPADSVASSSAVGADARELDRAVAAAPAAPVDFDDDASKVAQSQPGRSVPPAAAMKDALGEESQRRERIAAAPAVESSRTADDYSAGQAALVSKQPVLGATVNAEVDGKSRTNAAPTAGKREARAMFARKADSGAGMRSVEIAEKKTAAATRVEVVCLLHPNGDTIDDLERLLRREGARNIAVEVLEPRAVYEALAHNQGRLAAPDEPSRGWMVTAGIPRAGFARLLEILGSRTGLRVLKRPDVPAAPTDQAEPLDLRLTVLR